MGTEGNLTALMRIKPSAILGVPCYIYHLVRFAQEKGQDLSFIKKIILGAAKVTPAYKQKLLDMLGAQGAKNVFIFGTYGFTEARAAWAECPAENHLSSGYHLYPDKDKFFNAFFIKLAGTASLEDQVKHGATEDEIRANWQKDIIAFKKIRKKYLLYDDFE